MVVVSEIKTNDCFHDNFPLLKGLNNEICHNQTYISSIYIHCMSEAYASDSEACLRKRERERERDY